MAPCPGVPPDFLLTLINLLAAVARTKMTNPHSTHPAFWIVAWTSTIMEIHPIVAMRFAIIPQVPWIAKTASMIVRIVRRSTRYSISRRSRPPETFLTTVKNVTKNTIRIVLDPTAISLVSIALTGMNLNATSLLDFLIRCLSWVTIVSPYLTHRSTRWMY